MTHIFVLELYVTRYALLKEVFAKEGGGRVKETQG